MRLPTRSAFAVVSPLRPEDARLRLSAAIGTPTSDERPFSGRIDGRSFDVMRSTRGRNSLRPRIRGTIEAAAGGSRIEGTMQLHGVVIALVAAIIALPTLLFVSLLRYSMNVGRWESSILVIPGAVVVLITMTAIGFAFERRRALKKLRELLEGDASVS